MNKHFTNDVIQVAKKHLKMCSNKLFIKGMQSKNWGVLLFTYKKS